MKILFDQGTPDPLRQFLKEYPVTTAYENGWETLSNGDLLNSAEAEGFNLLITTDQNLQHEQNLSTYKIAIVVLLTTSWPKINRNIKKICLSPLNSWREILL